MVKNVLIGKSRGGAHRETRYDRGLRRNTVYFALGITVNRTLRAILTRMNAILSAGVVRLCIGAMGNAGSAQGVSDRGGRTGASRRAWDRGRIATS
jgi:hypothetical protein